MSILGFGRDAQPENQRGPAAPVANDINKNPEEIEQQKGGLTDGNGNEPAPTEANVGTERPHTNDVILEQAGDRLIKKEVSLKRGDNTPVAFMYTRVDGSTFEVAAESLLVAQLDEKLDKQAVVSQEEIAATQLQAEPEYAKPEYRVVDVGGNVLRSYNVGIHGPEAKAKAEQYAAKVAGFVKEII